MTPEQRLFIGVFPAGISYCDRAQEVNSDWLKVAFLAFDTLELTFDPRCPECLVRPIRQDAAIIQAKRGELYQVSTSGQTVRLGGQVSPEVAQAAFSQRSQAEAREAAIRMRRRYETARLQEGQAISYSGFAGTVSRLYSDGSCEGARMYEVRLPGGTACVCGSDLIPTGGR